MNRKILMIGLDGATFDVLNPLMEEGRMPNLSKLIAKGASGCMLSTVPPVSGPAWTSLATGMKPEKNSIYDFTYRKAKSYQFQPLSSLDYAGKSVWDYLSKAGKRVGILNYPMCVPPYKVNGFMSAGLGASQDSEFTFPTDLKQELNKVAGGEYELYVGYHDICYEDTELFLDDLQRVLAKKLRVATYLIREKQWDFFCVILSETDWLQHIMWRHLDKSHSLYEGNNSKKFHERFKKIWCMIDEAIGDFSAIVGEQSNIVIVSDHGFGPNDEIFKLNVWLEREGYLVWRKRRYEVFNRAKEATCTYCKTIARRIKLHKLAPRLYKYGQITKNKLIENVIDQIDLEKSVAFDPGHTIPFGGIYINDRLIHTPQKKQELSREITEKLRNWGSKNDVNVDIWQRSNAPGDEASTGPDILVGIDGWQSVMLKDRLTGEVFERRPYSSRHTGSHRMDGIFIGVGPDIQSCRVNKVPVYNIAPTILYLFNIPIPQNIDGQVCKDIVTAEYLNRHPVKLQNDVRDGKSKDSISMPRGMTQQEKDVIQQKLKDLGYM
jgi:predicted AlkP superfamily phosphohydrolase/phosphomutase